MVIRVVRQHKDRVRLPMRTAGWLTAILVFAMAWQSVEARQDATAPERAVAQAEALVLAARDNDVTKITSLINNGIDVNVRGTRGTTPLMSAAAAGSIDAVRFLVGAGADVNAKAPYGKTALSMAIEYFTPNHSERNKRDFPTIVRELIAAGADINVHDYNGLTPLLWASAAENEDIARVLIDAGAGVNTRTRVRIRPRQYLTVTPLIYSIIIATDENAGTIAVADLLLEKGADVTAKDSRGRTALAWAELNGDKELIALLRKSIAARRQ